MEKLGALILVGVAVLIVLFLLGLGDETIALVVTLLTTDVGG